MNKFTEQPINTTNAKRLFSILMLLLCLLPVVFDTAVITPLYVSLESNVAFSGSILTMVIYYLKDIFSIIAFASSYAIIIFSVFFISKKAARFIIILYGIIFFVQIPLKILMNAVIYGSLGTLWEITMDIIYLLLYFALNMIQLLLVYFFATTDTGKYLRRAELSRSRKKNKGKAQPLSCVLPLCKFLDFSNPLQSSAFKMGALMFALKVFSRILNDISYGAPASFGEVLVMAAYYLSDLLYGVVAYLIALLIFTFIYDKLKKKEADEEGSPSAENEISLID